MPICPIHHTVMKPRVIRIDITYSSSGIAMTDGEWERYVDRKHESAAKIASHDVLSVCKQCPYAVRQK